VNKILVLPVLLLANVSRFNGDLTIAAASNVTLSSMESANLVCDNFNEFKKSTERDFNFKGESCERFISVFSASEEQYTLVDFYGPNGFILLGDNMQSYDFKIEGEFYLSDENNRKILFSNGLYYYPDQFIDTFEVYNQNFKSFQYSGQVHIGYGGIKNPSDYIIDRYDSAYKLIKSDSFSIMPNEQDQFNIYVSPTGAKEGNCTIVASYTALNYIRSTNFYNLNNELIDYTPSIQEASLYNSYVNQKGFSTSQHSYKFNNLFIQLRNRGINRGYTPDGGLTIWNTSGIIEDVSRLYGYSIDGVELINYTPNFSTVISQIGLNKPMLWSTLSDPSYKEHVMVINGYKQYRKTEKVWLFTNNYYANLLAIYDGWKNEQRYFDITAYGSAIHGGALVRFDYAI
jgi:hypothetical protein